ncbi:MAG: enoyl-CoA hydratase/isomerase family protein [Acidobacteriota bacterium]|jgi:methylglutaconyl-CoA hydratase
MATVRVTHSGATAILHLDRPASGNALDQELIADLTRAVVEAPGRGARAIVLTGEGKHFCAGADLRGLLAGATAPLAARVAEAQHLAALYAAILRCPLLTVAAVHGAAYGGGAGLAGACDLVIASPAARFMFSEVRLGFVPALISVFLPRRVAVSRLLELFLDPRPLSGEEARAVGLVDEVREDPVAASLARTASVAAAAAPGAVAATKRLALELTLPHLDQQLAYAAGVNAEQRGSPECVQGVRFFLAHQRPPDWSTDELDEGKE